MAQPFSPQEASLRGRIGAHKLHATHDPREITGPARRAFLDRFEREADPDGTLDPAERARRAYHLRTAHFTRFGPNACPDACPNTATAAADCCTHARALTSTATITTASSAYRD